MVSKAAIFEGVLINEDEIQGIAKLISLRNNQLTQDTNLKTPKNLQY